ncbi:hypothetical protein ACIQCD_13155 [Streptomyces sp. NPDC093250]|uniref:hypothetical protein n=1 Tax=unclassified Streptomyces TaxID=2593676 RepID=UPI00344A3011
MIGLAGAMLAAMIGGFFTLANTVLADALADDTPDPSASPSKSAAGSDTARPAAPAVTYDWHAPCARRYLKQSVEQVDPTQVPPGEPEEDEPVVADDAWLDISVENRNKAELQLTELRIEEIDRSATPRTGILLRPGIGCAEGTAQFAWDVALDEQKPTLSPKDMAVGVDGAVNRISLPYTVSHSHSETFRLYFNSEGCSCRFRVVLEWTYGGEPTEPSEFPDDGKRFHVVPRGDLPGYRLERSADGQLSLEPES